jgi:hypothetical protein
MMLKCEQSKSCISALLDSKGDCQQTDTVCPIMMKCPLSDECIIMCGHIDTPHPLNSDCLETDSGCPPCERVNSK